MTPDQMRIAIAERCGWKLSNWKPHQEPCGKGFKCQNCGEFVLIAREDLWLVCKGPNVAIPNYPGDLNAMHEAEKCAPKPYWLTLLKIVGTSSFVTEWQKLKAIAHATALQRATAFCKTLNLETK